MESRNRGSALQPGDCRLDVDARLALEIAEFVGERAQHFVDHECRAWALTDFGVWAALGGQSARLTVEPGGSEQAFNERLN